MNAAAAAEDVPEYSRLEEQIAWYDSRSISAQRAYKRVKLAQVVLTASVPLLAFADRPNWLHPWALALVGAVGLILETVQQTNQWHHNWTAYRSTCEALRHEKYCYLGAAGPYDLEEETVRRKVLVQRVESLISAEHSKWFSRLDSEQQGGRSIESRAG